jgi:hypothetical protein
MTRSIQIAIDLPETLLRSLGQAARAAGVTPSHYLRSALAAALDGAARPAGTDPVLAIIATAENWLDLQGRLRGAGYVLRRAGADSLMLHDWPLNRPILPLADLGHSLAALTLRFRAPFPADVPVVPAPGRGARRAA